MVCPDRLNYKASVLEEVAEMKRTFEAVYENGTLRPLSDLELSENEKVQVTIESSSRPIQSQTDIPSLRDLFGSISHEECDRMSQAIEDAFERVDLDEWK